MPAPRFRTLELSDPAFESENLRHLTVKSPNLDGRGDITVFVPSAADGATLPPSLPLVTLLHGVYGSHWVWTGKAGVHLTAQRLIDAGELPPMLIAMPSDGLWFDGSGYLPHNERRFDEWIVDDVPNAVIEAGLPTDERAPRFICGLSMGGYGALRLGAAGADRFSAVAAHSSLTDFDQMRLFVEEPLERYGGPPVERSVLAMMIARRAELPPVRFDCGVDDELIDDNRALHRDLLAADIAHEYAEHPGGHEWEYWARHIEDSLRFFAAHLPD